MTVAEVREAPASTEPSIPSYRAEFRAWLAAHEADLAEFREVKLLSAEDTWARSGRLIRTLSEPGWNLWGWPVEVGGLGGSPLLRNAFYDELEFAGYPIPDQYVQFEVQGPMLIRYAAERAAEIMPAALHGEEMWTQGFSEPGAGSDLASLRCRAERRGDHFVLNGQKIWSSYAVSSQRMSVLTRTGTVESRHRGLTMFSIDIDMPGVEVRPIAYADGRNELAEVFYDNVEVDASRIIGEENGGWAVAMYLLQFERANYGWMRQAHLERKIRDLAAQSPDSPAAAEVLGDLWVRNLALRARCGATVLRLAADERIGPEASIDKVLLGTAEQAVTDAGRDLLETDFLFDDAEEFRVGRAEWLYSRAATVYGGAGEVQRGIIADHLLGLPKEVSRGR